MGGWLLECCSSVGVGAALDATRNRRSGYYRRFPRGDRARHYASSRPRSGAYRIRITIAVSGIVIRAKRGAHGVDSPVRAPSFTMRLASYWVTVVAFERPISRPSRSRATTTTELRGSATSSVVSYPFHAPSATRTFFRPETSKTSQRATSVAPFQMAWTVVSPASEICRRGSGDCFRLAHPLVPIGAVAVVPRGEGRIEDQVVVAVELGEPRERTPVDERVAVVERFCVALRSGQKPVGVLEPSLEGGGLSAIVVANPDDPRVRQHRGAGLVVKDANQSVVVRCRRVVLPCEGDVRPEREIALRAAEPPKDGARVSVDPVGGPRVASADQQIAVFVDADRVQVEVIPCDGGRRRHRRMALVEPDVVQAMPLEEDMAIGDVDLLDDAFGHEAPRRAANGRQILARRCCMPRGGLFPPESGEIRGCPP